MFGMSPALTGGIIGLAFGVFSFLVLSPRICDWIEAREGEKQPFLRATAWGDLVLYPAIGYAIGYYWF